MFIIPVGATTISIRETVATRNYLGETFLENTEIAFNSRVGSDVFFAYNDYNLSSSYQEPAWRVLPQRPLGN